MCWFRHKWELISSEHIKPSQRGVKATMDKWDQVLFGKTIWTYQCQNCSETRQKFMFGNVGPPMIEPQTSEKAE